MIHEEPSELAGKTVLIKKTVPGLGGKEYHVEDWCDRVVGELWRFRDYNHPCMRYFSRVMGKVFMNDEVLYGKIGDSYHLVHISEIEEVK